MLRTHSFQRELPQAVAIVNPNQHGCEFACKQLAGVGVIFYVMLALRRSLIAANWFEEQNIEVPNMGQFLDLVALGTFADVVPLVQTNRILVHQGVGRIRQGKCRPGISALLTIAKRQISTITASDLGFAIGPHLNAAGRLDDMSLGIECLLATDPSEAERIARQLDELNFERRNIEQQMKQEAQSELTSLQLLNEDMPSGLCFYDSNWHQGVIGILAGRIKDQTHRPVVAFANSADGIIKGSARSVAGFHIRDALDHIATENPGLITKFGGHAMAAGLSLAESDFQMFKQAFANEAARHLTAEQLQGEIYTDGALTMHEMNLEFANLLRNAGPWGQNFPEPVFDGEFTLVQQRIVGGKHLKLSLQLSGSDQQIDAIAFNVKEGVWPNYRCDRIRAVYRLDVNFYRGEQYLQLILENLTALTAA